MLYYSSSFLRLCWVVLDLPVISETTIVLFAIMIIQLSVHFTGDDAMTPVLVAPPSVTVTV